MGVISKGGIRGKKRPGRACQHCDRHGSNKQYVAVKI